MQNNCSQTGFHFIIIIIITILLLCISAAPSAVHHVTLTFSKRGALRNRKSALSPGGTEQNCCDFWATLLREKWGDKVGKRPQNSLHGKTTRSAAAAADQRQRRGNNSGWRIKCLAPDYKRRGDILINEVKWIIELKKKKWRTKYKKWKKHLESLFETTLCSLPKSACHYLIFFFLHIQS